MTALLDDLRVRGLSLHGGLELRVVGQADVLDQTRPLIRVHRDALLDALQDEAEDDIASWPQAYRRWLVQTIAFALREGFTKRNAFWMAHRGVRAALEMDRARVIAEAAEGGMLKAALDSGLVTVDQVAAGGTE